MPLARKMGYIVVGTMALAVMTLAIAQPIIFSMADNVPAFGVLSADSRGWPADDQRGAFLILNEPHDPLYPGNLVALLATTEPGVVDEKAGAHLLPTEIKTLLVQSASLNEVKDYRVYRIGVDEQQQFISKRQPGGKVLLIETSNGKWEPGAYLVDIPAEGMFGGRSYFQFYVDEQ